MQAPEKVKAVQVMNISLRMLHADNQSPLSRPLVTAFQSMLRNTSVGEFFFSRLATAKAVKNVLQQAYHDSDTVTDELVECVLKPGMEPGAVQVFLDFIRCGLPPCCVGPNAAADNFKRRLWCSCLCRCAPYGLGID